MITKTYVMQKIEHIGIAVKNLKESIPLYEQLLQAPCYKTEVVESEQVHTAFFQVAESKIELLQSTDPLGVINKFIAKKGEGLHHIAFEVADIQAEVKRLQALGFKFINPIPKSGADNKQIVFLHPKSCSGVLIELCEELKR